jgi:hypothetical protein
MTFRRFLYWTFGFALLPFLWVALHEVVRMIPSVLSEGIRTWWLYVGGAMAYFLFEKFLTKPMTLYVVGHELTHALSGLLSGAKIHSFKAGSKGGEVRLSKTNLFVALSPYVVPIYALLVILLFALLRLWWKDPLLSHFFQFFLGAALAFHLSMTVAAIHRKQPDLKIMGIFLSGILIAIGNVLILGVFCVSLFKKTPTLKTYSLRLGQETAHVWKTGIVFVNNRIESRSKLKQEKKV